MSRPPQKSTKRLRIVVAMVLAGLVALLALTGCGAGQNTQTDSVVPAVNGAQGQAGGIAIRDAQFAFPRGGSYAAGGEGELVLAIVNTGSTDDELVEVTSSIAGSAEIKGDRSLPARRALQVGNAGEPGSGVTSSSSSAAVTTSTSAPATSSPIGSSSGSATTTTTTTTTEPVEIGKTTIVLKGFTESLRLGKTYPVTFVFRNAGPVTVNLPIASPTTPRPEPTGESHG